MCLVTMCIWGEMGQHFLQLWHHHPLLPPPSCPCVETFYFFLFQDRVFLAASVPLRKFPFTSCPKKHNINLEGISQSEGDSPVRQLSPGTGVFTGRFPLTSCSSCNHNILNYPSLSGLVTVVTRTSRKGGIPSGNTIKWQP